jgi:hypothetical protein
MITTPTSYERWTRISIATPHKFIFKHPSLVLTQTSISNFINHPCNKLSLHSDVSGIATAIHSANSSWNPAQQVRDTIFNIAVELSSKFLLQV